MWDQLGMLNDGEYIERIIPTYVGSTHRLRTSELNSPNHSHVCGINYLFSTECSYFLESFPRMWDQPLIYQVIRLIQRIIPTYVGSTRRKNNGQLI